MTKYLFSFFLIGIFLMSISSCLPEPSTDVNQDKIYTTYELFYNSNTDKTVVVAQFRFGNPTGTVLELENPAFVKFNDDILQYNILYGGHAKEYAGQLTSGTFSYTDADENTFVNDVPAYEAIAFPSDLDSISKAQAYDLIWDGTALSENQRVGVFVGSWSWGNDALFLQTENGATNMILGADKLSNVQTGQTTFYMDRTTEVDVAQGTSEGGKIRGKYRASNVEVWMNE